MRTATKKAPTSKKAPKLAWDQQLFELVKKQERLDAACKLDGFGIEGLIGCYDNNQEISVELQYTYPDAYDGSIYIFNCILSQFPGSCGTLVVHDLPENDPALYPFFFDIINAVAHKMKYGLVMLSHCKGADVLKAAEAYGFHETDTCHNPNTNNTITLMSKVVTKPTQKTLLAAVRDMSK